MQRSLPPIDYMGILYFLLVACIGLSIYLSIIALSAGKINTVTINCGGDCMGSVGPMGVPGPKGI